MVCDLRRMLPAFIFAAAIMCAIIVLSGAGANAQTPEYRAYWVDAWHPGFKTPAQCQQLIQNVKTSNCNAVFVQMRRRADTYYPSAIEPWAPDADTSFDALRYLLDQCHAQNPPIEVHAWLVLLPMWTGANPPTNENHPYFIYPHFRTKTDSGTVLNTFDPGHPECEQYLCDVVMELVNNYPDLGGISYDYSRFGDEREGYNDVSVARFNARNGRTGKPSYTDAAWSQWRRDQITNLIRKTYVEAIAVNPSIIMSSAVVTWDPSPQRASGFTGTRPYYDVFQDWDGWMREGILDLSMPMNYYDADGGLASEYDEWGDFAKSHAYNRGTLIGPGIYMNDIADSIMQIRATRTPYNGYTAKGVVMFSYATTSEDLDGDGLPDVPNSVFYNALSNPSAYDPNPIPVFSTPAPIPTLPWKTNPTKGHVRGTVFSNSNWADGALVKLTGPETRQMYADGTGYYAFVDVAPGTYTISATYGGQTQYESVTVNAGIVSTQDFTFTTTEIVVDDESGTSTGTWTESTAYGGHDGDYYYIGNRRTNETASWVWTPNLPYAGRYDVYEYHIPGSNRTSHARFTINSAEGSTQVEIDQRNTGAQWVLLKSNVLFNAGTSGNVRLTNVTGEANGTCVVIADAIKFVYLGGDNQPTSVPQDLQAVAQSTSSIKLTWSPSTDDTAVAGYRVFRGAQYLGTTPTPEYIDSGLAANTQYSYTVTAYDAESNESPQSAPISRFTLSVPPTDAAITCNKSTGLWYNTPDFTFTNGGFGQGKVNHYGYVWNNSATHNWTGDEDTWASGSETLYALSGWLPWYLHLRSYNGDNIPNGTLDKGPYFFEDAPPVIDFVETTWYLLKNGSTYQDLSAKWLGSDSYSGIIEYSYCIGTSPGAADILDWTSVGTNTQAVYHYADALEHDYYYYFSVKAKDRAGNWSAPITSHWSVYANAYDTLAAAMANPDGTPVIINNNKHVTANFGTYMYVQEPDRSRGIRLAHSDPEWQPGDLVTISGRLATTPGGERQLTDIWSSLGGGAGVAVD